MSGYIAIRPIGFVEREILHRIAERLVGVCNIPCRIEPPLEEPTGALDRRRSQYNSKIILKDLQVPSPDALIVGITWFDLYVPVLKFVFGLARLEGRCAVVSLHRLQPQFYNEPPNPELLALRAEKTVLHELGHSLGLVHCRNRLCVMFSSTRIEETDYKRAWFCPDCLELFMWYLGGSVI